MITIFRSSEAGLVMLNEVYAGTWVNVVNPTAEEISQLEQLGVFHDFITYPLDLDERARTERDNGDTLIVIRIPCFQGDNADIPYTTIPLGIILTGNFVVTICKVETDLLRELAAGRMRGFSTAKRNRFVLHLLLSAASKYLGYLREINRVVDGLEDKLQLSMRNRELLELLKYQKSLTYFTTALRSNELMMERLQRSQMFQLYPDDLELLEDVLTENQQAIEMVNIAGNILSQMMDAFASIISNNLNVVMKFLTSITILLSLPVLLTSAFGMNVPVPMGDWPYAFWLIMLVSLLVMGVVLWIFNRHDWL